jgi:hypothetical protein
MGEINERQLPVNTIEGQYPVLETPNVEISGQEAGKLEAGVDAFDNSLEQVSTNGKVGFDSPELKQEVQGTSSKNLLVEHSEAWMRALEAKKQGEEIPHP